MQTLIVAQTIYYFSVSAVIIIIGVAAIYVGYALVKMIRELHETIHNVHTASSEAIEAIRDFVEKIAAVPFLSLFLKHYARKSRAEMKKP